MRCLIIKSVGIGGLFGAFTRCLGSGTAATMASCPTP
jgi:hypothetical protein